MRTQTQNGRRDATICGIRTHYVTLLAALLCAGILAGCGGYSSNGNGAGGGGKGISASITNSVTTLQAGTAYTFTATTPSTNGYSTGITWTITPSTGAGTLSSATNNGFSSTVMYQAPSALPNPNSVTITATPSDTRVAAASDTFTIAAAAMSMFQGQFAMQLAGSDSTGQTLAAVGNLTADGAGKISGGSMDLNRNLEPAAHVAGITGTYTLDSHMHGSISLAAVSGKSLAFSFVLDSGQQSGVITGTGANGGTMSGHLVRQDPTAFSLEKISSAFAFKLEANSSDRLATVGKLSIGSNSALSGTADQSKSGQDPVFDAAQIAGHLTAVPDANGRGTFILTTPAGTSPFVFYVASDSTLFLLETDTGGAARTRQVGLAERQALPFSAATANGAGAMRAFGFDTHPSSLGGVSVTGSLAIQNLTHATLSWSAVSVGAAVSIDSLRSDLVTFDPSTGRGTIQVVNGSANDFADSVAFYLASPGRGFFLDKSAARFNRALAGDLAEPSAP